MSNTLYRKYRPKNFSEIIGQKHIVQTLSNAVKNGRVGQAYLFTGPRGTGKTSIARIFAKTINCAHLKSAVTCEKCENCRLINENRSLDIIEIDAASNTGVDNMRELRETVALPPTSLKYKVYIIDEVHMLSTGAFNALLKTLEEPPTHVVFILATTEIHKVPDTILSRCQRFDFTRLPIENIVAKLSLIAKAEKIKIDSDSLEMIAIAAEGGMRDAESLLGQVITLEDKNITKKEVEEILGTTDRKFSQEITAMIIEKDATGAIQRINELLRDGYDLQVFTKSLLNYLRQLMLLKIDPSLEKYFSYEMTEEQTTQMTKLSDKIELDRIIRTINLFLEAQSKIASSAMPQLPLEIAVIRATRTFPVDPEKYAVQPPAKIILKKENKIAPAPNMENGSRPPESRTEKAAKIEAPGQPSPQDEAVIDIDSVKDNWKKLLADIKTHHYSMSALLASCRAVSAEGNEITVAVPYDFYKEKLDDPDNRLTVEDVFGKILGLKIRLKVVTDKEAGIIEAPKTEEIQDTPGEQNSLIDSALEIMGAKVVEEN